VSAPLATDHLDAVTRLKVIRQIVPDLVLVTSGRSEPGIATPDSQEGAEILACEKQVRSRQSTNGWYFSPAGQIGFLAPGAQSHSREPVTRSQRGGLGCADMTVTIAVSRSVAVKASEWIFVIPCRNQYYSAARRDDAKDVMAASMTD
jgi:hypothetical protein